MNTDSSEAPLKYTRLNWMLFAMAAGVILAGYALLRVPPADGLLSLTVAPLLLVLGYVVLIPVAIMKKF